MIVQSEVTVQTDMTYEATVSTQTTAQYTGHMEQVMLVSKAAATSSPTSLKISQTITLDNEAGIQTQVQTLESHTSLDSSTTETIESTP